MVLSLSADDWLAIRNGTTSHEDSNLSEYGSKFAPFDRAVSILPVVGYVQLQVQFGGFVHGDFA